MQSSTHYCNSFLGLLLNYCRKNNIFLAKRKQNFLMTDLGLSEVFSSFLIGEDFTYKTNSVYGTGKARKPSGIKRNTQPEIMSEGSWQFIFDLGRLSFNPWTGWRSDTWRPGQLLYLWWKNHSGEDCWKARGKAISNIKELQLPWLKKYFRHYTKGASHKEKSQ